MKFIFTFFFGCALVFNQTYAQEVKSPLIMQPFEIKVPEATVYRFARENSPVITKRTQGKKILVVKEKNQDWLMVQIGGVNSYVRKYAVELHPEKTEPEGFQLLCFPDLSHLYRQGRQIPTGYKNQNTYIISNRDYRYNSMQ